MSDNSIGSESTAAIAQRNDPRVVAGGSVSGDAHTSTLATSGNRSTGAAELPVSRGKRTASRSPRVLPKAKHASYALLSACIDNLDRARDHQEEFFLRNNALEQLKDTLSELWSLRSQREEPFAEIVNMLQAIFAQRTVENFTADDLTCLRSVFFRLREESVYSDVFANEITVELLNGGIDAFRELE